jgi:hypothetical protein
MINMRCMVQLEKKVSPGGYAYRSLMVDVYKTYQNSHEWRLLVDHVKKRDNYCCCECGNAIAKFGTVHHKSYENWGKSDEREMFDCVYVCRGCHIRLHKSTQIEVPFWAMTSPDCVVTTLADERAIADNFI